MSLFTGSGVAIVTPFNNDNSINFDKLNTLINWHISEGTDAIIICGTTGEASTMNDEEHLACIDAAVQITNKRIPVIAGTGSNDTQHGIYLSKEAQRLGADGLLHVTPYYNKTTQRGLIAHFGSIANSVDIPIMLYNVPSRTGMSIAPSTLKELSRLDTIVALKEASGDIGHVVNVAAELNGDLDIYSGNDDQIIPLLSLGGKGVVSVVANILPQETHNIVEHYLNGQSQEALKIQLALHAIITQLFCETNPIPVKEAMNLLGMGVGPCRLPLYAMEASHKANLHQALIDYGVEVNL